MKVRFVGIPEVAENVLWGMNAIPCRGDAVDIPGHPFGKMYVNEVTWNPFGGADSVDATLVMTGIRPMSLP